ncbi:MAG: ECF transporter S component [Lachnospiraceae bacterium]|nr:ECF transporter S component [Lachnospiraceae bacterium]
MDKIKKFFQAPGEVLGKLFDTAKDNISFLLLSIAIVAVILAVAFGAEAYFAKKNGTPRRNEKLRVRRMTQIALLSAVAFVLNMFSVPLGFLPTFYKIDLSELPVLVGAFTLGPVAGVVIEFIKIMLNVLIGGTTTAFVGEFANFLIGCAFVVPAAILYFAKKSKRNAVVGIVLGTVVCVAVGCFLNAFVLLPAYAKAFHMDISGLVAMGAEKNGLISGMFSFVVFAVAPFNLIKCSAVGLITMLIYKRISLLLKGGQL